MPIVLKQLSRNLLSISFVDKCKLEIAIAIVVRPTAMLLFTAEACSSLVVKAFSLRPMVEHYLGHGTELYMRDSSLFQHFLEA